MELPLLLEALSRPDAYPYPAAAVEVRHTHISAVFLAGLLVYKIKKPVDLGFLDFSTLEKRRHFCEEEVRLNRRLAPSVYLGVVPVVRVDGKIHLEGDGEVVEWAVKMTRLPEEATLAARLERGDVGRAEMETLARKLADFHVRAEAAPRDTPLGRWEIVARNVRENYEQASALLGSTIHPAVFERLQTRTEESLTRLRPLIEARADHGIPRDTHGDLHLDHVYFFPDKEPPDDWVIIDCIEFNERFRFTDPVADMAFLRMDLLYHDRRDLAQAFTDAYFAASGDAEGLALVPFYTAYRAAVRGKVEGIKSLEKEVPEAERAVARQEARAHWLLALGEIEEPKHKPCLALVGGLPGTGKSTLARGLAESADFSVLRTDVVRKELAGLSAPAAAPFQEGIYLPEWTERTYAECLRRAEEMLFEGKRVLVDASFISDRWRRAFLEAARRWGVSAVFFLCQAAPEVVGARLAARKGDASDADWSIYLKAAECWEEPSASVRPALHDIATGGDAAAALSHALTILNDE